jgi:maltose/maltodextrin transport system substrate-binding protein
MKKTSVPLPVIALPSCATRCGKKSLCLIFIIFSTAQALAWTDGELLIWISSNRPFHALTDLGEAFEKEMGAPVKVETQEQIIDKFQTTGQNGKGPDVLFWANDRIGEWADSGLLKPLQISEEFKARYLPMSWDAVMHKRQVWGYPISLEAVSLIYNRKLVAGKVPAQLSELPAFAKELKMHHPKALVIMWDYKTPYFSWPFLASAGGYPFKKTEAGYDINDIGVANAGALDGLTAIVQLIKSRILPKGSSQSITNEKMASGDLALMISGPWDWANLRKAGVDFELAPIPGVNGNPGRPFVGVFTVMISRFSPNAELAQHFLEEHVLTSDGLKAMDREAPIGVPALKTLCDEMAAQDHLIKMTYENVENGIVMPNIPQMGKFWGAMRAAFDLATSGGATPSVALEDALNRMKK